MPMADQNAARLFAKQFGEKLVYEANSDLLWEYVGIHFVAPTPHNLQRRLTFWLDDKDPDNRQTMGKLNSVFSLVKHHAKQVDMMPEEWVTFDDCDVNVTTGEKSAHSPEHFSTVRIGGKSFDARLEGMPTFSKFLKDICVDEDGKYDEPTAMRLQEIAGYLFHPDNSAELAFFLYGSGANGKSVYLDVLRALIGKHRVANVSLRQLTNEHYYLAEVTDKKLIASDESNTRECGSDTYKMLVSGQEMTARRAYGKPFTFRNRAKLVISMNVMPSFDEMTPAMKRRTVIVPFNKFIPSSEKDVRLAAKVVEGELPAVFAWAMEGLRRLKANNWQMTPSEEGERLMNDFESASSSVLEFMREKYVRDASCFVRFSDIYDDFKVWSKENGRGNNLSKRRLGTDLTLFYGKSESFYDAKTMKMAKGYRVRNTEKESTNIRMDF